METVGTLPEYLYPGSSANSASQEPSPVFFPIDVGDLRAKGLLHGPDNNGMRRIHKRRLTKRSDEWFSEVPLDAPVNSAAYVSIPDHLISVAALRYVGFTVHESCMAWFKWKQLGQSTIVCRETDLWTTTTDDKRPTLNFMDFMGWRIMSLPDVPHDELETNWQKTLESYGLTDQTVRYIMNLARSTTTIDDQSSCSRCALRFLHNRYRELQQVQRASYQRHAELDQVACEKLHDEFLEEIRQEDLRRKELEDEDEDESEDEGSSSQSFGGQENGGPSSAVFV